MSITNKLIANIKQTNVDITKFTDTNNVICIDTSNNRIGVNTKTPRYAIDICGINSKIFVENLDVGKQANLFTISANNIMCSDASFTNNLDASFINVKTISGSLITAITLSGNTILGTFGNIRDFSAHNVTINNNLYVSFINVNEISANIFKVGTYSIKKGDFSNVYVAIDLDVSNNINVTNTITTNTLIATTISCETLKAKNIRCLQTLSADTISSDNLVSNDGIGYFTTDENGNIVLNRGLGENNIEEINDLITDYFGNQSVIQPQSIRTNKAYIEEGSFNTCNIRTLTVKNIEINTDKGGYGLLLPEKPTSDWRNRSLAINTNSSNPIFDSLIYYNSSKGKWSNIFTETHYATLDLSNIFNKNLASYYVIPNLVTRTKLPNYRYIPIKFKSIKTNTTSTINNYITKTDLFFIKSTSPSDSEIDISNVTLMNNGIYEINASITLSYTNTISGDVEPNDYTFGLYNRDAFDDTTTTSTIEISYNYVKNKNLILAFDNSYNFSSVSLHYIGPLYYSTNSDNNSDNLYRKGLCYLINSQKDISNFNVEYFSSTIKLLNYSE
jgi:hypothetical protein